MASWDIGGVGLTIIINTAIAIALLVVFFTIMHPCITIYNTKKKKKLLKDTVEYEAELCGNDPVAQSQISETEENDLEYKCSSGSWWRQPIQYVFTRLQFLWFTTVSLFIPSYNKRDREHVCKKYGRDLATFLYYQQLAIYAMLICSVIAMAVLIPVHMTGTEPDYDNAGTGPGGDEIDVTSRIIKTSVEMRIEQAGIQAIHVCLALLFMLIFGFFMIFLFMKSKLVSEINYCNADEDKVAYSTSNGRLAVKNTKDSITNVQSQPNRENMMGMATIADAEDVQPRVFLFSPYCVFVEGIPTNMDQASFHDIILGAAQNANVQDNVAKIALVPNFTERLEKHEDYLKLFRKYHSARYVSTFKPNDKNTVSLWCKKDYYNENDEKRKLKQKYECNEFYNKVVAKYSGEINSWDNRYNTDLQENMNTLQHFDYRTNDINETNEVSEMLSTSSFWEEPSGHPKATGVAYVMFRNRASAKKFLNHYLGGIYIAKTHIGTSDRNILKKMSFWKSKNKAEKEETGSVVTKSKKVAYKFEPRKSNIQGRLDILGLSSLRVSQVSYEPDDVDWKAVFAQKSLASKIFKQILIFFILIFIFLFVSTPAAVATGLQEILQLDQIEAATSWVERFSGAFGSFFFQYLPTLIVLIASALIPKVIIMLTVAEKRLSHSDTQRTVQKRIYIYLLLSVLILPTFALAAVSGVFQYFAGEESILNMFGQVFIPSAGAFFLIYILHEALLSHTLKLYCIGPLIKYTLKARFSSNFWLKTPLGRHVAPTEKLMTAELPEITVSLEYAFLHLIIVLSLTYSVFQPIILVCGLLYFLYRYYTDRYLMLYAYGHRKKNSLYGASFGFKADFKAHYRTCIQQVRLLLVNMLVFSFLQAMFYATKVVDDQRFIPHLCILLISAVICALLIPVLTIVLNRNLRKNVRQNNLKDKSVNDELLEPAQFLKIYEAKNAFPFLPRISYPVEYLMEQKSNV